MSNPESNSRKVLVLTPRTYELIGKIVTKASYLEFAIFFMATAANPDLEGNFAEILKKRPVIIESAKLALEKFASTISVTNFLSKDEFFEQVNKALGERDAIAHGIIQRVDGHEFMAYHPKGEQNVSIDDVTLEGIYGWLDKLEADAYLMRNIIWSRAKEKGLIQLGALDVDHTDELPGTRLA